MERITRAGWFAAGTVMALAAVAAALHGQVPALAETGFTSIFDGKTLNGWDGDPDFWRVENGRRQEADLSAVG